MAFDAGIYGKLINNVCVIGLTVDDAQDIKA